MYRVFRQIACFVLCLFSSAPITSSAAEFSGVGFLGESESRGFFSKAYSVSNDGTIVVGVSSTVNGNGEAFRWTDGTMTALGYLDEAAEDRYGNPIYSAANKVSGDGSVIVGASSNSEGNREAFRWTHEGGMTPLGILAGFQHSEAWSTSDDGSVIIGRLSGSEGEASFIWTESGMELFTVTDSFFYGNPINVSGDGNVIVGYGINSDRNSEAFYWTQETGTVGMGFLPGGLVEDDRFGVYGESYAVDVNADGSVIVGDSSSFVEGAEMDLGTEAFRWTAEEGMVGLGFLPGGFYSSAYAVSADGNTVVGDAESTYALNNSEDGYEAFVWNATDGMQSIMQLLIEEGVDLTDWFLLTAYDVSADGTVIVGEGVNPDGNYEGWLARISPLGSGLLTEETITPSLSTLLPVTESSHSLARESLDTHLMAARHYRGGPDTRFNIYVAGFGGEWNSYTAGGTFGIAYDLNDSVRLGGGLFTSTYHEDDLAYSSEYELESFGGTLWAGYEAPKGGLQLHAVGLLANLDNEIERGYMNGSGLDRSTGSPDGTMAGLLARLGWKTLLNEKTSFTPFASYTWSEVEIDAYTETGGGFPAQFDRRKDSAEVLKLGIEGETLVCQSVILWGQAAYGNRLDDDSDGISGGLVGLMDFTLPGFDLDDEWFEADLGIKWQVLDNMSITLTGGSAFGNDQNPKWRTSLGLSLAL